MPNFALIKDGIVLNVIVAEADWAAQHAADIGATAVDVTDHPVSPGQLQRGNSYIDPVTLTASKDPIAPTGSDASTVTYTDNRPSPPASVDGTVNGQPVTVPLTNGVGSFDVTSTNSGDTVAIVFPAASLSLAVT